MAGTLVADTIEAVDLSDGTNTDSITDAIKGSARAWVHYNGVTNTIEDSYNVSSVTDTASGKFEINFTTNFSDAYYVAVASVQKTDATDDANMRIALGTTTRSMSVSSCPISISYATSTSMIDTPLLCMAFFK